MSSGKSDKLPRFAAETFVKLLAPFAPHVGEELWEHLGHSGTIAYEPWPEYEEKYLKVAEAEILVQVLGRPKARIMMPTDASNKDMEEIALADDAVKRRCRRQNRPQSYLRTRSPREYCC